MVINKYGLYKNRVGQAFIAYPTLFLVNYSSDINTAIYGKLNVLTRNTAIWARVTADSGQ